MVLGHLDQGRDIQTFDKVTQCPGAGPDPANARKALVAGVKDDRPAIAQELVDPAPCVVRKRILAIGHRPVDQREKGELIPFDVQSDRCARLDGGAAGEDLTQTGKAGPAGFVDFRIAGQHIGKMGLFGGLQRKKIAGLRMRRAGREQRTRTDQGHTECRCGCRVATGQATAQSQRYQEVGE